MHKISEFRVTCPKCGRPHKHDSVDCKGWWQYVTGKWTCDCGAEGLIWYLGHEISKLEMKGDN